MLPLQKLVGLLIVASLVVILLVLIQRRRGLAFAFVVLVDLGLAVGAVYDEDNRLLLWAAIALFGVIIIVPSLLVATTRAALRRGRYRLAVRLTDLRQMLQPGLGLQREKQVLATLALIQGGHADEAIERAHQQLDKIGGGAVRAALLEQLLTLYIYERRWDEARQLFEDEGGIALASVFPGICSAMVRVFGELGAFEEAGRCQVLLEQSKLAHEPGAASVLNSSRLTFLALLGQSAIVDRLLANKSSFMAELSPIRRTYWRAIAYARGGDLERAHRLWQIVARQTHDAQAAEAAEQRLADGAPTCAPDDLGDDLARTVQLAGDRALAYGTLPRSRGGMWRLSPISTLLVLAIVAVHVFVEQLGGSQDPWVLLRMGANFSAVSLSTEPWRLIASMFLHGGWLHLALNGYALYLLGRFTEQLYGSWRFWVIYAMAGMAGSVTSALFSDGRLSVGASGAIFGLIGAMLAGLRALRGQVPEAWRRRLSFNLLVVIALQLGIGFSLEVIDNAAHVGGLFAGGLIGLLLRPARASSSRASRVVTIALGTLLLAATAASAAMVARTGPRQLLDDLPRHAVTRVGLRVRCPTHWFVLDKRGGLALQDPLLTATPTIFVFSPLPLPAGPLSLDEIARQRTLLIAEGLRESRGLEDLTRDPAKPHPVAKGIVRTSIRLSTSGAEIHQLNYFHKRGDVLLTIWARVNSRHLGTYRPLLDEVAASATVVDGGEAAAPRRP